MEKIPIWLDCDPGHDDVFAILLAVFHPRFNLLGISTVFGNSSLDDTTNNAASFLTAIGKHKSIPLHRGHSRPLERTVVHTAKAIHGKTGLDGTDLMPEPACTPSEVNGVDAMAAALDAQPPNTVWIVAVGALTNVGALLRKRPEISGRIRGLSVMGGAIGDGFTDAPLCKVNGVPRRGYTPWAEFNILMDPEAAAEVFSNEVLAGKTTLIPLDLTHQVLATSEVKETLLHGKDGDRSGEGKSTFRRMMVDLLFFFSKTYSEVYGITEGPPLHDPLAVAVVLMGTPDEIPFFEWDADKSEPPEHNERFHVTVVTEGTLEEALEGRQTGRTIAEELADGYVGVRIPRKLDVAKFWEVIEECMQRADDEIKQTDT